VKAKDFYLTALLFHFANVKKEFEYGILYHFFHFVGGKFGFISGKGA